MVLELVSQLMSQGQQQLKHERRNTQTSLSVPRPGRAQSSASPSPTYLRTERRRMPGTSPEGDRAMLRGASGYPRGNWRHRDQETQGPGVMTKPRSTKKCPKF